MESEGVVEQDPISKRWTLKAHPEDDGEEVGNVDAASDSDG
jgi:hypothetical protein